MLHRTFQADNEAFQLVCLAIRKGVISNTEFTEETMSTCYDAVVSDLQVCARAICSIVFMSL
jgi:hypothetical protein